MQVWVARNAETAQPAPPPTTASLAKASASHVWEMDTPAALNDLTEPKSSGDTTLPRFTWWPKKATREWVQYEFAGETTVDKIAVYWFDDFSEADAGPANGNSTLRWRPWLPASNPSGYGN